MIDDEEQVVKDEFYYFLLNKYNWVSEESFCKNYKAIKLGYLLAHLEEEEVKWIIRL